MNKCWYDKNLKSHNLTTNKITKQNNNKKIIKK